MQSLTFYILYFVIFHLYIEGKTTNATVSCILVQGNIPTPRGKKLWLAYRNGNTRKGYWAVAGSGILTHTITNKRLAQAGYFSILDRYESLHTNG